MSDTRGDSGKKSVRVPVTKITLGLLGMLLVLSAFLFLQKTYGSQDSAVDQGVVALLIVGLCTLIVVEVLPTLQNLKFGKEGIEVSFRELGEKVTNDTGALEGRVKELETLVAALSAQGGGARRAKRAPAPQLHPIPAQMLLAGRYDDDPRKGRFGGRAEVDGFALKAAFPGPRNKGWTEVELTVTAAPQAGDTSDVTFVEFYLHNSFKPDHRSVTFHDGQGDLCLTTWGGFTVGVWIPARGVMLELDLASLSDAPKIVKEL
jgi:hypothetical protein